MAEALHGSTIYQYFEKLRPAVKDVVMETIKTAKNPGGAADGNKANNAAKDAKAKRSGNEKIQTTA
jgi:hypothetical protein